MSSLANQKAMQEGSDKYVANYNITIHLMQSTQYLHTELLNWSQIIL